jgi:hypothetical protein
MREREKKGAQAEGGDEKKGRFTLDLARNIDGNFFPKFEGEAVRPWVDTPCDGEPDPEDGEAEGAQAEGGDEKKEGGEEKKAEGPHANKVWPCYVCERRCRVKNLILEHCHLTGDFRGWGCKGCNKKLSIRRGELPVLFHNFSGYNANLVMIGSAYVNNKILAQGGRLDVDTIPQGSNLIDGDRASQCIPAVPRDTHGVVRRSKLKFTMSTLVEAAASAAVAALEERKKAEPPADPFTVEMAALAGISVDEVSRSATCELQWGLGPLREEDVSALRACPAILRDSQGNAHGLSFPCSHQCHLLPA